MSSPEMGSERVVRRFPPQEKRVETGPIEFEGDWPGLFIRGDNALIYAVQLECQVLPFVTNENGRMTVRNLIRRLKQCDVREFAAPPEERKP